MCHVCMQASTLTMDWQMAQQMDRQKDTEVITVWASISRWHRTAAYVFIKVWNTYLVLASCRTFGSSEAKYTLRWTLGWRFSYISNHSSTCVIYSCSAWNCASMPTLSVLLTCTLKVKGTHLKVGLHEIILILWSSRILYVNYFFKNKNLIIMISVFFLK